MSEQIKRHELKRADVSEEAQALIDTTADPTHTLDEIKDQTMSALEEEWSFVPDINSIYPYQILAAYGDISVWALCKVRTWKKDNQVAGWFIGVVSADEYGRILLADNSDRDAVMVDALAVDAEGAVKWTAHY